MQKTVAVAVLIAGAVLALLGVVLVVIQKWFQFDFYG